MDVRMTNKWRERLNKLLEEDNAIHNTTTTLRDRVSKFSENVQTPTAKTAKTQREAERLGMVATWSVEFGYISIHYQTTGEWHDLKTEDAPSWAKREAFKRKELYGAGNRKAYRLTSREMEEIWKAERVPESEGILKEHE